MSQTVFSICRPNRLTVKSTLMPGLIDHEPFVAARTQRWIDAIRYGRQDQICGFHAKRALFRDTGNLLLMDSSRFDCVHHGTVSLETFNLLSKCPVYCATMCVPLNKRRLRIQAIPWTVLKRIFVSNFWRKQISSLRWCEWQQSDSPDGLD